MNVKIKRVKDVPLPKYAKPGDSGFDLVAAEDTVISPGETKVIPSGLAFEIPEGYELQIRPRSGISAKTKLRIQLGTIDSGFRGEVGIIVDNIAETPLRIINNDLDVPQSNYVLSISGEEVFVEGFGHPESATYIIRKNDRIAQAVIAPVEQATFIEVDTLEETQRGSGGFGSSGVKSKEAE